jgi:anti-sigma factor RsiW
MTPVTQHDLHALIDDRLPPDRRAQVEEWLRDHDSDRLWVEDARRQRAALRELGRNVLDEPVPERLLAALDGLPGPDARGSGRSPYPAWGPSWRAALAMGLAAGLLALGGVLGWVARDHWPGATPADGPAALAALPPSFVRAAVAAYAVYVPEVRHPVEVAADQQEHLVQWLSKRLGRPLKAPRLDAQGFALLGGRLLPAESGANAQFMYQNAAGERVTVYLTAIDPAKAVAATAFRYVAEGDAASFYWVERDFGYAVTGRLARERIQAIAQAVYAQTSE